MADAYEAMMLNTYRFLSGDPFFEPETLDHDNYGHESDAECDDE